MKEKIKNRMSMRQIVGYGSGCLGANLMNNTVSSFISFYYTEVAGLPIAAVGLILLACRLLDGLSDLIMGAIVERTYTREGKARPWIKRMAIPFGLSIFLMFLSPSFGMTGKIISCSPMMLATVSSWSVSISSFSSSRTYPSSPYIPE